MKEEEIDFIWSSEILLRHGFVISGSAMSPVGPTNDESGGIGCSRPKRKPTMRRRVSWNLSEMKDFPPLPFPLEQQPHRTATSYPKLRRRDTFTRIFDESSSEQEVDHRSYIGSYHRDDYVLGDVIRSSSHMMIESSPDRAIHAVDSLKIHDFAWVKRSDGFYTYAILAYRNPPIENKSNHHPEEYMYFVVDNSGSTKMILKKHWHDSVRLIFPSDCSRIICN